VRSSALDVGELINGLAKMVRPLLPANVELLLQIGADLPPIEGDAGQLEQMILNLCLNARDAMPGGGALVLSVDAVDASVVQQRYARKTPAPSCVRITVEDTGVGMSAHVKDRLFDPFFTTKPAGKGTGLGLSMAYAIVQGHGGFVHVDSEPGRGSRLEVFIPAGLERAAMVSEPAEKQSFEAHGETVLVAEDVDSVRDVVASLLRRAGYRVLTAADGESAVRVFREHHSEIDLVLLDVVMPKLSGPQAFEEMKAIKPAVRGVFTSGYADAASFRAVRSTGAALVPKPYEPAALLRALRIALA
jgi:two-component system cell cycle sensor histidine kinase/response regulator CckA